MIVWDDKQFVLFSKLVAELPFCDQLITHAFELLIDEGFEFHSRVLPKYMVEPLASKEDLQYINIVKEDEVVLLDWIFVSNLTFKISTLFASKFFQEEKPRLRVVQ